MLLNFADIALKGEESMYFQLYTYIKTAIGKGILKNGERLPSVREAATQLGVSRTTVENAYTRLCIEGIIESRPQKGYFIIGIPTTPSIKSNKTETKREIIYDFSSRLVDAAASDTELWKKLVRSVLWDSGELNSYGDPQGEQGLREALSDYSFKARGVTTSPENIVIGAGVGPLLNILCGLLGRNITVGFENGGFTEAERIFTDYGIITHKLDFDRSGATVSAVENINPDILFLLPSALSKISPTALSQRRNFLSQWAKKNSKLIIEDDYNGELRYNARSVPAFQRNAPENTVYIGSFSKLLLPSVRIAYMVLPDFLAEKFRKLSHPYNQTCGKIEQLALEKYIVTGALEKHLRKLRRLYYTKSQLLIKALENHLEIPHTLTLFESSLTVEVKLNTTEKAENISSAFEKHGIKTAGFPHPYTIRLCFGGIAADKITDGIKQINEILKKI